MNTFSFVPMKEASLCYAPKCATLTRIRIEDIACCEEHMAETLQVNARQRLAQSARQEHDRRRTDRRSKGVGNLTTKEMKVNKYKMEKEGTLYRITALKTFGCVLLGARGGLISSEKNLSQTDTSWVSGEARVFGEMK
jgi:hypothetical protein